MKWLKVCFLESVVEWKILWRDEVLKQDFYGLKSRLEFRSGLKFSTVQLTLISRDNCQTRKKNWIQPHILIIVVDFTVFTNSENLIFCQVRFLCTQHQLQIIAGADNFTEISLTVQQFTIHFIFTPSYFSQLRIFWPVTEKLSKTAGSLPQVKWHCRNFRYILEILGAL